MAARRQPLCGLRSSDTLVAMCRQRTMPKGAINRLIPHAIGPGLAATISLVATGVAAQQSQGMTWCANKGDAFSSDLVINGCTVVIDSNKERPRTLALAFNNRGLAYAERGRS